jgi:glycosyltransferase involved in cell wall biosynthesis
MSAGAALSVAVNEPSGNAVRAGHAAKGRVWVTWETQRRNATISRALGCRLFEFDLPYRSVVRYPLALALTLWTFLRERPSVIFVQNPSMVLSAFAVAYGRVLRIPVIVDAHNAAVEPLWRKPLWQAALARFILRRAALTIVSNDSLARTVKSHAPGAALAVLPDPIPQLTAPGAAPTLSGKRNVLYICSWAEDEPYREALEAARFLPRDTFVYVTGRSGNRLSGVELPPNVVLTGYVDEQTYLGLLYACDVVLDLTTWADCLLCGAYEAVSAERPMVLSGTAALRAFFHRGAVYTDNTPGDLVEKIERALSDAAMLHQEVRVLKAQLVREWESDKARLEVALSSLAARCV